MKAPKGQFFLLTNGKELKNLHMLVAELPQIHDAVFNHHVTPEKNDFAEWVQNSINEIELSGKIRVAKNKHHMRHLIKEHIKEKSIYDELQASIRKMVDNSENKLKTRIYLGIFIAVSLGALITFFSMLF